MSDPSCFVIALPHLMNQLTLINIFYLSSLEPKIVGSRCHCGFVVDLLPRK